jgi:hypothetical protein
MREGMYCIRLVLLQLAFGMTVMAAEPPQEAIDTLYAGFRDPPPSQSLSPYWFWNGKITADETRRQLRAMAEQGVRSATVMNWAGLEPAYLSEAWWREVGSALDAARDLGVSLNFSDEFLWPSGQAWDYGSLHREPSRVLQLHPEYRMRRLTVKQLPAGAPQTLDRLPEVIVAARLLPSGEIDESSLQLLDAARTLAWTPPAGDWRLFVYTAVEATERGVRTDLLNPAAVRAFLDTVYEQYARRFPQHLGSTIRFFVSDHEGAYGAPLPYTPALWDAFHRRHHYDLRPMLPLLSASLERAVQARQDYLETVSHLYAVNYVQQITDWCSRHKVEHGHSDIEETLLLQVLWTGDMFQLWRASSAVYIDALLERARMPIDFQEALSVAHLEKRPLMVETHGLLGHDSFFSLEKSRRVSNMAALWGAHRLIAHYFEYDPTHLQYPPSNFLTQPTFGYFHHYASTFHRVLHLNSQGTHHAPVAIYYPLESAFANSAGVFRESDRPIHRWGNSMDETQEYYTALQLDLARHGWEYHILDSHYLAKAALTDGSLGLGGERFRALLLPPMSHIAPASLDKIRRFAAAGGLVLALDPQPRQLAVLPQIRRFPILPHEPMLTLDYRARFQTSAPMRQALAPLFDALRTVVAPAVEVVEGSRENLYFSRRAAGDVQWFWAVNDSADARDVTARFPGTVPISVAGGHKNGTVPLASRVTYERWDAETGSRHLLGNQPTMKLHFEPWDAFFIVRTLGASSPPPLPSRRRSVLADLSKHLWQFTPESPVRVPYAQVIGSAEPVWLAPERLAQRSWWLSGPYPYGDHDGFFNEFPPERGYFPGAPAPPNAQPWQYITSPTSAVRPPVQNGVYYAFSYVWSPSDRKAYAAVAVADSVKLWLNGKLELAHHSHPPFVNLRDPWSLRPALELKKGWNTLLLKIGPASAGATGFLFRLTDAGNNTLRDLVYTREKTLPASASKRVRLTAGHPPGTAGRAISLEMDQRGIPERPYVFQPLTTMTPLFCWTDTPLAHYSGTAVYETAFTLEATASGKRIYLDLGRVGLAAEAWIDGKPAGSRAWSPYELDVTGLVHRGANRLRIRVANSDAGWMSQGDPIYENGAWGIKFAAERDRLQTLHPNGLEGPVRLLTD